MARVRWQILLALAPLTGLLCLGGAARAAGDRTTAEATSSRLVMGYARTAVVIGVHPSVPEDEISFEDLVNIYRGTKTRWRNGQEIIVLTREPGDSSIEVLERQIPGFKKAYAESRQAKRWTTLLTDQEMNRVLARTPHAIGLSDMGALTVERLPIKPLKINGIPPATADVRSAKYPLVRTLVFEAFLHFVRSSDGERILTANGYLPEP